MMAYLLPGFIALAGVAPLVPTVAEWLRPVNIGDGWLGPPVYAVLAAFATGLIISCFRWLLIDPTMRLWGVGARCTDFRRLEGRLGEFNYWVEQHYRYYQFFGGAFVAVTWAYLVNRILKTSPLLGIGTDLATLILCAVLLAGARDSLQKYRQRISQLVG